MKTDKGGSIIKKINRKWIFPVIHMVISFLYMTFGFKHHMLPFGEMMAAWDINWSNNDEKICFAIISSVFGFCLICIVWHILFLLMEKKRKLPFFLLGLAFSISFLAFPGSFSYEPDNLMIYFRTVRNIPDYWQSIYVGYVYKACLFVFPHPLMVSFLQLSSLFGALYYISARIKKIFGKKVAFIPYMLILFPEFLELGLNPYRNCIYTIMCLWFYAFLFFDCLEERSRPGYTIYLVCLAGVFLAFFRSEGIVVLGILIAGIMLIYKVSIKHIWKYLIFCILICLILVFPQKLGEKKYYGSDYSMINSMNILKTILSDKNINLEFETAEKDLAAINKVVPLEELTAYGISAYRINNYVKRGTINQSFLTEEEAKEFMGGVKNLIIHNPILFLKDRLAMFCEANGIKYIKEEPYPPEEYNQMLAELLAEWNYGYREIVEDSFPYIIFSNNFKYNSSNIVANFMTGYLNLVNGNNITFICRVLVFLLFPVLVIYDMKLCNKKKRTFFAVSCIFLLAQLAAVILFCPEGRSVYYFPPYFIMLLGCFLLALEIIQKNRQVKTILPAVTNKL